MIEHEEWQPIADYVGMYEASSWGRVRNARTGRVLSLLRQSSGHRKVHLYRNGVPAQRLVHRLVLGAFLGPSAMGVRHLDGDPSNNRCDNLVYGTQQENIQDSVDHGTQSQVRKTHCPAGHAYTPENTYSRPSRPGRECRTCKAAAKPAERARAKAREDLTRTQQLLVKF